MLELLDTKPPELLLVEPFPVPETSSRRRVIGLDVWLEFRHGAADVLRHDLVGALLRTPARLTHLDDLGGRPLWPASEPVPTTKARARVVARNEDVHLTDAALLEVLGAVSTIAGWSVVRKLEEFDGIEAFTPLGTPDQTPRAEEQE